MCGIAGMMSRDGRQPDEAALERLVGALAHRGPDGRGHYLCSNVAMVHTRLAIIDLETGDQPLFASPDRLGREAEANEEGRLALVANGEIYNDLELRRELGGEQFATGSDCEPPLHLYRRYGDAFAERLRGMYAIAIHDPRLGSGRAGRLVLARDSFGIKPLYYVETAAGFAFASEAQALIAAGLVRPSLRREHRDELLQLQFTTGRLTPYAGIERVLPGETVVVENGYVVRRRQRPALPREGPLELDESEALAALDRVLEESVRLHQRSDVPYGMFLSGGIDSTVLLATMARINERPLVALTAGFPSAAVADERADARAAARACGAEHLEVTFDASDFWTLLPAVAASLDDPAADYAALPAFKLARAARQAGLKVVLTGEGGDELFAGYGRYRRALRARLFGGRSIRARGALDGLGVLRGGVHWRDGIAAAAAGEAGTGRSRLQVLQAIDCVDWLPNDLLTKLDRSLMAHGVEGRVPYIDTVVAPFAFRLPDRLKIGGGLGKWLLRRWLEKALPAAKPFARKRGFTVPVGAWIADRAATVGPLVATQPGVIEACHGSAVNRLFANLGDGRGRLGRAAWLLLFFALWHQRHIVGAAPGGDVFETLSAPARGVGGPG